MICMETTISTICSAMTSMIVTPSMLRGFILPWVAASGPVPVASGKATKRARAYGDLWEFWRRSWQLPSGNLT